MRTTNIAVLATTLVTMRTVRRIVYMNAVDRVSGSLYFIFEHLPESTMTAITPMKRTPETECPDTFLWIVQIFHAMVTTI